MINWIKDNWGGIVFAIVIILAIIIGDNNYLPLSGDINIWTITDGPLAYSPI